MEFELHPKIRILDLKAQLAASYYKAIKHSEGLISEEDYAPIKAERQAIRERINELEAQLAAPAAKQTEGEGTDGGGI